MIEVIGKEASPRKLRLAACACVRMVWADLSDPQLRDAVETAEDYADFRATKLQVKAAKRSLTVLVEESRAQRLQDKTTVPERAWDLDHDVWWALTGANESLERQVRLIELLLKPGHVDAETLFAVTCTVPSPGPFESRNRTCELFRDVFGNPFRPVVFSPEWRTDTTLSLARTVYDSREFSAMPILADALQDAGCDNDDVLTHCRDANQVHVRGCWVIDLVLGK
jgi:hypothetical protein